MMTATADLNPQALAKLYAKHKNIKVVIKGQDKGLSSWTPSF